MARRYARKFKGKRKSFSKRKFTRKSKSKRSASFAKAVKRVIMKVAEPKVVSWAHVKFNVAHNTPVPLILNASNEMPVQGVGDNQRVGDQINMSGFKIKMLCGQFNDRENVTWQFRVVAVPKGSTYVYNNWFDPVQNNATLDDINTDFVKVLKSWSYKYVISPDSNNTEEFTFIKKIWIPYKKVIKFGPANAAVTTNDPYDVHLLVTCYDAYGTLSSDSIGYLQLQSQIYYRDP